MPDRSHPPRALQLAVRFCPRSGLCLLGGQWYFPEEEGPWRWRLWHLPKAEISMRQLSSYCDLPPPPPPEAGFQGPLVECGLRREMTFKVVRVWIQVLGSRLDQ